MVVDIGGGGRLPRVQSLIGSWSTKLLVGWLVSGGRLSVGRAVSKYPL